MSETLLAFQCKGEATSSPGYFAVIRGRSLDAKDGLAMYEATQDAYAPPPLSETGLHGRDSGGSRRRQQAW